MGGRVGFIGVLILVGVLCYTDVGDRMWNNVKGLDSACYSAMTRMSSQIASPVCGSVSKGIAALESFGGTIHERVVAFKEQLFGNSAFSNANALVSALSDRVGGLASSGDTLSRMVQAGPGHITGQGSSFQQAIDSFTIGQNYLNGGGNLAQALPWLKQGAQQPQGYGVMSQITLGNLYARGGAGVSPNPQMAQYYLSQAQNSIAALSTNRSPQSQQLLQALPGSPEQTQAQIQQLIHQLGLPVK